MGKKHELYVKAPVYFGIASLGMSALTILLAQLGADGIVCYISFFIGFACVIAGMIFSCMEKGKSEEEMKYSRIGVAICLILFVIYGIIIWLSATLIGAIMHIFS